jgi:hypothetical protein
MNEQRQHDSLSLTPNLIIKRNILFSYCFRSFITNLYGRVQAFSVMIIHGAVLPGKTPQRRS